MDIERQIQVFLSGGANVVPLEALKEKLKKGTPLRVKLGVDPTAPDLHLGHAVPLRKLRQLQNIGHQVVLIIGDGTALIGDPSGRNSTRPPLTAEEIAENAATYVSQAFKILNKEKTELVWNGNWLTPLTLAEILRLSSNFTVARILERDDFSNRYKQEQPISLHEFLYPVMQAYDSVVVEADMEIGGTDQLFNLLAGRELMEKMGMEPQVCLTLPLLEGTDGKNKMSKTYGNYIGITDEPADMFGKVMSIPDELMPRYYHLTSSYDLSEVEEILAALESGSLHPNLAKRRLAANIVIEYWGANAAVEAEAAFDKVFKDHGLPEDIPVFEGELVVDDSGEVYLPQLLAASGLAASASEARRLIDNGGVKVAGEAQPAGAYHTAAAILIGSVLQVGKRRHIRIE
ncbi:MAG: tyrosine--tRNA ligase [Coriobacteriia bacterium]|nr:tyrosine--tRNA ligase [Coriobacteriia bacterium]MCL2750750.1 tyrosine--tRNA ligase [Coriobacteriia bacterium]